MSSIKYSSQGRFLRPFLLLEDSRERVLLLFEKENSLFDKPKMPTPEKAQDYFDLLYPKGHGLLKGAVYHLSQNDLRVGVFSLHQAAVCFYNTVLLLFKGYKLKTPDLMKLRDYAMDISMELYNVFAVSESDKLDGHLFDLLNRGYTDARDRLGYDITADELRVLIEKMIELQGIVDLLCKEKIDQLMSEES